MIDNLKDLKDIYELVRSAIDRCKEPKSELLVLSCFLQTVAADPSILAQRVDKDYQRYFYEDFTQGLLKRLIREKSNDEKYLDIIGQIFESYVQLSIEALKSGNSTVGYYESMKFLFEYDNLLHSYHYQISEEQMKAIRLKGQTWRNDLQTGDMVDAIQDENMRCSGWSQAQIHSIHGDLLQLKFIHDNFTADRIRDKFSLDIAPFESKSKQTFEWKQKIEEGHLVDAFDKNIWNKSTILAIKDHILSEERTIKAVNIAYRVYCEKGNRKDERGSYDGYSDKYDEWIPLYSPRIQPFHTKTQRQYYEEITDIDDDFDVQYPCEQGHSKVFAVPRNRKCTSQLLIHLINQFGNDGGFELVLDTISRYADNCNSQEELVILCTLIEMVSKPYMIYHKEFQKEYFPKIISQAKKAIMGAPDKLMRDVQREKVEAIIRCIDNMQKRLFTKEEREKETETLKLEMCHHCLKSSFFDRRIQGIKDLNQIIKNNRMSSFKSISNSGLVKWLNENDIFSIIFDPKKTHLEIVRRSNEILKLLLSEDALSPTLFEMFWSLSKQDYKVEVYKILNDIAFQLKKEHFDFVLQQIVHSNGAEKMSLDDYQCINEMAKFARDEEFKANVNRFFWDLILKADQQKTGQLVTIGLSFIRTNKIQVYKMPAAATAAQQQDVIGGESIQELEKAIIESVLKNLGAYCQQVIDKINNDPFTQQLVQTETRKKLFFLGQKFSHHEEIEERLLFLKYVAGFSYDFKITKQELNIIYDLLVKGSPIPSDNEEFLIWCKNLCESSSISKTILDLNEVGEFFTAKMKNGELDIRSLPIVGFEFLQHYFLTVNEKSQKLLKSSQKKASKFVSNYNNFSTYGYYQPPMNQKRKNSGAEEDEGGPVFKLLVTPSELEQVDIVWNVALKCENPKVVPKAINFLIKVHYHLDEDLSDRKHTIQDELIHKCMDILKEANDEFTLNRVIDIIKHIIYEAEKKGTGNVQPHNAVLKGELLERIQIKYKASTKKSNVMMSIYSNTTVWEFKKEVAKQLDLAPKYLKLDRSNGSTLKDIDNGKTLAEIGIQSYESLSATKLYIEEQVANAPLIGSDNRLTEKAKQIFTEWFNMYSDENKNMTQETCTLFIKGCTGDLPSPNDERIVGLFAQYDQDKDGKLQLSDFLTFYETASRNKPDTVRENLRFHNIRSDLKKLSEIHEESSFETKDMPRFKISENQSYFDELLSLLDRSDSVSQTSWDLIQMLATNRTMYRRVLQLENAKSEEKGKIEWSQFFDKHSAFKLLYTLQIVEAVMEEGEGQNLERIVIIDEAEQQKRNAPVPPPLPGSDITPPGQQTAGEREAVVGVVVEPVIEQHQEQLVMKHSQSIIEEEEYSRLKSDWTKQFLQNDGIQYILSVFMEKEIGSQIKEGNSNSSFNQIFELKHIAFLLKLLRIFIMAAFSTSKDSQVYQVANLVRRSSSMQAEGKDSSSADREMTSATSSSLLQQNNNEQQKQENQNSEGSRFKELQTILAGPLGEEIIQQIDYKLLQQKILRIIAQILSKQEMIFEDKLIIENALSLWVGCVLHRNELFNEFYSFSDNNSKINNCETLILSGLLFCPYEKVRDEFRQSLSSISLKLSGSGLNSKNKLKEDPLKYLLNLLSRNITKISAYHSKQYFDLFCSIIEYYFMMKQFGYAEEEEGGFNPEQLLSHMIDKIKEYNQMALELNELEPSTTDGDAEDDDGVATSEIESVYVGLIQLTSKIIDNFDISLTAQIVEQKNLIEEVFVKFLFASVFKEGKQQKEIKIQPKKQRKTKKKQTFGSKSKDAAYKLINSLIKRSPLLMNNFLEKSMLPLLQNIRRLDIWNYTPAGQSGSTSSSSAQHQLMQSSQQKYVGLRNLGCICYMNSMLQQFFMIPAFRYNLLCVDDQLPENIKEYKGFNVDDNMLHQLQKLMAHLELSQRSEYNPFEFCFSFKEMDGNPTNTGEQKDAQEFLNIAFDRIENCLKQTSRKYLLQSVFGGQVCNQFVCQECGNVTNRIEDFYNLSLEVKDIKSMHESLQKNLEGEIINGYQCDGCSKKVDVSKRILISQTPNVLIVHLKRIVFNYDSFKNDKLNSFFEFPYQLDLKPYSFYDVMRKENRIKTAKTEGEEEEEQTPVKQEEEKKEGGSASNVEDPQSLPEEEDCFEYKLVGTTVHSGTANAGHYWSYIDTKRGYQEADEGGADWNKIENDPWMEFNDSRVSEFNFEKLREECYGDQSKGGNSGGYDGGDSQGWSSWGSYGKSAYMLVYERRKKRPIKIVVPKEEAEENKQGVIFDQKKEEYYKLIDYKEGVEDIAPNKIYKQVHEDNKKFGFDNDIYSQEFFDFIKSIMQAALNLAQQEDSNPKELMTKVYNNIIYVGKKSILEILAKCFYNQTIKNLVEILIDIMKVNDELCFTFMNQCYQEDMFEYLLNIMLECPDPVARMNVSILVKFIINRLKLKEKATLYDVSREEVTYTMNPNTPLEQIVKREVVTPVAMVSKFMLKVIDNLNTLVAKNWSRFDYFLEMIYSFGMGDFDSQANSTPEEQAQIESIGLEFLCRQGFIGKACDFLLGRKSPMASPNEKRYEMGGSYTSPNFTSLIKLISRMINDEKLTQKYPLSEIEKNLLLQYDLMKVMLSQNQNAKQFGLFLAAICKDNIRLSKKVSKVFVKVINGSTYEQVKSYLKALKPFLRLNDGLKVTRLEWIFGVPQILTRKEYQAEKYKFGLELIQKVNDETYTYVSPIIGSSNEEALLAQLIKCKGRLEIFAINCLKEMLSLMSKDIEIARFIYYTAPPSYQYARYSDWIKPYLEGQKSEQERNSQYMSFSKSKLDTIIKGLSLYAKYEEKCKEVFVEEEKKQKELDRQEGKRFLGLEQDWLAFNNEDVLEHYPPQLIIGKQVGEEKLLYEVQDHALLTVSLVQITNEYNYSNPTGFFNISLPHIDLRTSMYQTMNYIYFKKMANMNAYNAAQMAKKQALKEKEEEKMKQSGHYPQDEEGKNPQEEEMKNNEDEEEETKDDLSQPSEFVVDVRDWFERRKEGQVLLKVMVINKKQDKVKFRITFKSQPESMNVNFPKSFLSDSIYGGESKCLAFFQKIDPSQTWGEIKVEIEAVLSTYGQSSNFDSNNGHNFQGTICLFINDNVIDFRINVIDSNGLVTSNEQGEISPIKSISCLNCKQVQSMTNFMCSNCGSFITSGSTLDPQEEVSTLPPLVDRYDE